MESSYQKVTAAFVNVPNEDEKKKIWENAIQTIEDIQDLLSKITTNEKLTEKKMTEALNETLKKISE